MKNKPPTGCSLNELAALIARATAPVADVVPPGWFTREQLQKQWGCAKSEASRRIKLALGMGALDYRNFILLEKSGRRRPTRHYSLAAQKY